MWIFAYGSLMWRPGFSYLQAVPATLYGLHRALCIASYVHRGTPTAPGLVLGLDRGGSCRGMAFQVAANKAAETHDYLRAREQVTGVYLESRRHIRLQTGQNLPALTFIVDRGHHQYTGNLPLPEQLKIVSAASGQSGHNREYILNTAAHLHKLGIKDRHLFMLCDQLAISSV